MTQAATRWNLQGDYFENCNCDFLCPCLFAPTGPLTALPTEGYCDAMLAFHVDRGAYGGVSLDGLSAVLALHADGAMGSGGWKVGIYFDERANDGQREALGAIFSGGAGGPMGAFAPLIGEVLGTKFVPITFTKDGRRRAVQIPNVVHMAVNGVPSMNPDSEVWVESGHPVAPAKLALATGEANSTFNDMGMHWDNSGKNGHYAAINWSNA
jgi:hypothetical protein